MFDKLYVSLKLILKSVMYGGLIKKRYILMFNGVLLFFPKNVIKLTVCFT